MVLVAVGQITSTEDVAHNLKISVQLAREAAAAGAKVRRIDPKLIRNRIPITHVLATVSISSRSC